MFSCLLIWYGIKTICDVLSILYRAISYFFFNGDEFGEVETFVLILGLVLYGTFAVQESSATDDSKNEKLLEKNGGSCLKNHFTKYFFCLVLSCLFVAYWITWIVEKIKGTQTNPNKNDFFAYLDWLYIYLCIPGFCILDVFFTKKFRKPNVIIDIIVLMLLLTIFCSFEFGYTHRAHRAKNENYSFSNFLTDNMLELILRYVCCILSYFLFDFLVYIRTKESGDYYHFLSKDTSKPKEKPKVQEIPKAVDSDNSSNEIKKSNEEK